MLKEPMILIISDSIGETAQHVVEAAAIQFDSGSFDYHNFSYVRSKDEVNEILADYSSQRVVVVFTLIQPSLRQHLLELAGEKGIKTVDIMGPLMDVLASETGVEPQLEPGLVHRLDQDYYNRVHAIEFTVKHDDGNNPAGIRDADVVLIGVSRTSKTPMSIYLSYRGYKAANIPLVPEVQPPEELFRYRNKVVGLTIEASLLNEIRNERLRSLGLGLEAEYASLDRIFKELDYADQIIRRLGCYVIDVTNKSIEEASGEIMNYLSQ